MDKKWQTRKVYFIKTAEENETKLETILLRKCQHLGKNYDDE